MVGFKTGTLAAYKALEEKDSNVLYFCTDAKLIFKGADLYTGSVLVVDSLPTYPEQGIIYILSGTGIGSIHDGTKWVEVIKPFLETLSDSETHDKTVTAKAVADYVNNKISEVTGADGLYVSNVEFVENTQSLTIDKGSDTSSVELTGVVSNPEYDPETRKITLPVTGKEDLVITLGKDLVVTNESDYDDDTKELVLVLTSGAEIRIPVGDLVKDLVNKADKVGTGKADEILLADSTGNLKASGKKIGGSTLAATPNANTAATEAAVKAAVDDVKITLEQAIDAVESDLATAMDTKVDKSSITTTLVSDGTKIPTSKVVYDALSWTSI